MLNSNICKLANRIELRIFPSEEADLGPHRVGLRESHPPDVGSRAGRGGDAPSPTAGGETQCNETRIMNSSRLGVASVCCLMPHSHAVKIKTGFSVLESQDLRSIFRAVHCSPLPVFFGYQTGTLIKIGQLPSTDNFLLSLWRVMSWVGG